MKLSVLHISDLHSDPANPIRNGVLIDSLARDRDRYTASGGLDIEPPNLLIVSGDIVHGVKFNSPDAEARLRQQYVEVLDFLNQLTDFFLQGNKRCVVIVPGNHERTGV
ncbi:MAG: metallophosphoesterase [Nitrospira sp.]|nr:metallophosphoesterase [Nitrospira sp.]